MQEFHVVLRAEDGTYNPLDEALVDRADLEREGVEHFDLMPDGTSVLLYRITGDEEALEMLLDAEPSALSYDVFEVEGDGLRAHVHFDSEVVSSTLIHIMEEYDLIVNPPIDIDEEGGLHVSVAGDVDNIREAAMMRPENIDIRLDEPTTEDGIDMIDLTTLLTERQQEVLAVATEKGYYDIPRQATNEDIAAELDCSTSTVGEHLRKIESRIISEVTPA